MGSSDNIGIAPPANRLPAATHVGAVRLQVADIQRSIEYYRSALGLRLLSVQGGTAAMGADRPLVHLAERPGVRRAHGEFGLYHFAILLPDRAALGRFAAHLVAHDLRAGAADHLVSEALYLTDPDGLGIEVYADRPRSTWRANGRELAMASDPLDLRGVIAAGQGKPWDGMPDGTTMGHVHLHVGDLRQAEAFYHAELGLDKMVWSYPGALFLAAGGYHHHLGLNTWSRGPAASDDQAKLLDWELVVPGGAAGTKQDPWGTSVRMVPS